MTKRTTIILFYCGVALVCAAILSVVNFFIVPNIRAQAQETDVFQNTGHKEEKQWFPIEKDLAATNQAGENVKLSDLRGKVWVVAEFFAVCPHCAVRNGAELRGIYDEFKDDPDFQMVCISVDPETDNAERLKEYAKALGAEPDDWWFLNAGDEKVTHPRTHRPCRNRGKRQIPARYGADRGGPGFQCHRKVAAGGCKIRARPQAQPRPLRKLEKGNVRPDP
jgi:protein SCO1